MPTLPHSALLEKVVDVAMGGMVTDGKWTPQVQILQGATAAAAGCPQLEGAARASVRQRAEKGARLYLVAEPDL